MFVLFFVCVCVCESVCACVFVFFHRDCGDPALLPSGGLSVSGAAEEKHSRGCLEKSRHMLPPFLSPAFTLAGLLRLSSHSLLISHRQTDSRPGGPILSLSHSTCFATVCAFCALFRHSSFYPLLPLCLFMLLLPLPDIFRDELQSTAGGKKN